MQIDENQPLAPLPFARNVTRAPIKCSNGQKQKGLASTLAPAPPINVGIDHFRGVPEAPRQLYPRNATLSGGRGMGIQIRGLHFLPRYSIFGDILDFPLVNARILVTELPRHWGVSPSNLHAFIVKFPFCGTSQVRRGQNLECFARFVFLKL